MSDNSKVKVKGLNGRSSRPMSYDHVSTLDFNVVKPFGIWELVPSDHITVKPEMWMRTQNLACPTFGKVDCITRAFFVPHRLVMKHFLDMWSQTPFRATDITDSLTTLKGVLKVDIHTFSMKFVDRFTGVSEAQFQASEVQPVHWNGDLSNAQSLTFGIWYQDENRTNDFSDFERYFPAQTDHFRFNPIGKRVWDLLYSLGYRFNFLNESVSDNYNKGTSDNYYDVSLLPILSYLKIFSDWYCPTEFKYLFNIDEFANNTGAFITMNVIAKIYDMLTYAAYLWYNDDMFSICEHFPYSKQNYLTGGPFGNVVRQHLLTEGDILEWDFARGVEVKTDLTGAHVDSFGNQLVSPSRNYLTVNGKTFIGAQDATSSQTGVYANGQSNFGQSFAWNLNEAISSFTVRAVQKAANWLQKNNLLTQRATDYLRAKFGVEPSAVRLDISEYIGSASAPVKISDVVSTEASDGKLGELGGKGTSYSIQELNYTAEEFGYFIVTVELRPRIQYGQGVNPIVLRTEFEDFWQEETDGLGFTPVPTQCVAAGPLSTNRVNRDYVGVVFNNCSNENRVFGYLPSYWSYKTTHGNLSGDFGIPKNLDIQSYHLFRNVPGNDLDDYIHNSLKFRYPGLCFYENDFQRVFMNPDTLSLHDHFQLIGSFDCYINGPVLAMSESWQVNPDGEERQGREQHIQSVL